MKVRADGSTGASGMCYLSVNPINEADKEWMTGKQEVVNLAQRM